MRGRYILLKTLLAWLLVAAFLAGSAVTVQAVNPAARTISIFNIDGDNATVANGARTTVPREGQRLSAGNIITTGEDTRVFLQMDRDSILQMNANSRVAVAASGNNLTLTVQSGAALINAEPQGEAQTLNARVGNVGLTVRGTLFSMGVEAGAVRIVMLSGEGDVNGVSVPGGFVMVVRDVTPDPDPDAEDPEYEMEFELIPIEIEALDLFVLEAIVEHLDYLIEAGTFTEEELEDLAEIIEIRIEELIEAQAAAAALAEEEDDEPVILRYEDAEEDDEPEPSPDPSPEPTPDPSPEPTPDPSPEPSPEPSPGTAGNPFLIGTAAQLYQMLVANAHVNLGSAASGRYFRLTADIGSTAEPWRHILGDLYGNFDGNGHTIWLDIDAPGPPHVGLFSTVGATGTVRNLTVRGSVTSRAGTITLRHGTGAVAGYVRGEIRNVTSHAAVTNIGASANRTGGLVGMLHGGSIINSRVYGPVNSGQVRVGGLVGEMFTADRVNTVTGHIINSHAMGNVSGAAGVGGLVGHVYWDQKITNSSAAGTVTGTFNIGGLVGSTFVGTTITDSHATGDVTGTQQQIGGLVGLNEGSIIRSSATGTVSGTHRVGGLAGHHGIGEGEGTISESFATGHVIATHANGLAGGLVGLNFAVIENSYATGSVTAAGDNAGGLVGRSGFTASVINSYAAGRVQGHNNVGGLAGSVDNPTGVLRGAVHNSLALNPQLVALALLPYINRVIGTGDASLANNRARVDMTFAPGAPVPGTHDSHAGADTADFSAVRGVWDDAVWNIPDGFTQLPTLINNPQNPPPQMAMPQVLPMIQVQITPNGEGTITVYRTDTNTPVAHGDEVPLATTLRVTAAPIGNFMVNEMNVNGLAVPAFTRRVTNDVFSFEMLAAGQAGAATLALYAHFRRFTPGGPVSILDQHGNCLKQHGSRVWVPFHGSYTLTSGGNVPYGLVPRADVFAPPGYVIAAVTSAGGPIHPSHTDNAGSPDYNRLVFNQPEIRSVRRVGGGTTFVAYLLPQGEAGTVTVTPPVMVRTTAVTEFSSLLNALDAIDTTPGDFTITLNGSQIIPPRTLAAGQNITLEGAGATVGLSANGSMFTINNGATLTLRNVSLVGRSAAHGSPIMGNNTHALVTVNAGGVLNMYNGAAITHNTATAHNGGGVNVMGTFNMHDGAVIAGNASGPARVGGGVYVSGTFNMHGGEINDNTAVVDGGGVQVEGIFNMFGGSISRNNANGRGGGVNMGMAAQEFNMSGGTIYGEDAGALANIASSGRAFNNQLNRTARWGSATLGWTDFAPPIVENRTIEVVNGVLVRPFVAVTDIIFSTDPPVAVVASNAAIQLIIDSAPVLPGNATNQTIRFAFCSDWIAADLNKERNHLGYLITGPAVGTFRLSVIVENGLAPGEDFIRHLYIAFTH